MDETLARIDLYAFFSRLFIGEIDEQFAAFLSENENLGLHLLPEFAVSVAEQEALQTTEGRERVFAPDFAHITMVNLVPYESFYRREDAMVEAGFENPVVKFYTKYGFEIDLAAARAISPDHIGIELEFMSVLAGREYNALAEGDEAYARAIAAIERDFLREHLLAWGLHYLLAVADNAKTVLYADGARALIDYLLTDYEHLTARCAD